MLKKFIKKLIIILPALLLFIITTKTKASDDTEIFISPSCTINVLDSKYVYADSNGEIGYQAWIPRTETTYTLILNHAEPHFETLSLELYQGPTIETEIIDMQESVYYSVFDLSNYTDYKYFRFKAIKASNLNTYGTSYQEVFYLNKGTSVFLIPYHADPSHNLVEYDDNHSTLVTSSAYLFDVDKLTNSIMPIDKSGVNSVKLIEDNYTKSYTETGNHTVIYEVSDIYGNISKVNFNVFVYEKQKPFMELDPVIVLTTSDDWKAIDSDFMEGCCVAMHYDSGDYMGDFVAEYYDGTQYTKNYNVRILQQTPGEYLFRLSYIPDYSEPDYEELEPLYCTLKIVDDQSPLIYIPDKFISLTTAENASHEDLCNYLQKLFELNNKNIKNLSIISTDYDANKSTPGDYTISYKYSLDGATYFDSCPLKVTLEKEKINNIDNLEINNIDTNNDKNINIIFISLIFAVILGLIAYLFIRKSKIGKMNK